MGVTVLVSSQNDNKGSISASNDRFARGDWGKFQDKLRIIKIAIKSIWTANAALVTSFLATSENHRHLEVAMLCALSDAQGKIRELPLKKVLTTAAVRSKVFVFFFNHSLS